MSGFFKAMPNCNQAYNKDASGHEYFGKAPRGATTAAALWQIFKIEYDGDNWVIKWPDGNDEPKHVWDDVESLTYTLLAER